MCWVIFFSRTLLTSISCCSVRPGSSCSRMELGVRLAKHSGTSSRQTMRDGWVLFRSCSSNIQRYRPTCVQCSFVFYVFYSRVFNTKYSYQILCFHVFAYIFKFSLIMSCCLSFTFVLILL